MYKTLSGREAAEALLISIRRRVGRLERKPVLAIVLAGNDPASQTYVKTKAKKAEAVGVDARVHRLPENVGEADLLALVNRLNRDKVVDGFIVQAPLPKHIDPARIMDAIDPEKDVDGWTPTNLGRLFMDGDAPGIFLPATPAGVLRLLDFYDVKISGKHVVVIGRSNVVGKPLAMLFLYRDATVTVCHSKTADLARHTREADILIAAAGVPGLITADMVKKDAYVVDVGTTKAGEKTVGDVQFDNVIQKANCSPVPGGVGPMTVAMLLNNVTIAAERREVRA